MAPVQVPSRLRARRCSAVATIFVLLVGGLGAPARAAPGAEPQTEAIVAEAVERFQAKDYPSAVELFEQAYVLSPEPNYLFNIGRVYEQAGDLEKAVEYYARFVKLPEVQLGAREVALDRLRVLRGVLEETAEKAPEPEPVVGPSADGEHEPEPAKEPAPVEQPEPEHKRMGMRIAGFVTLGAGVAVVAGGGAAGGVALRRKSQLDTLATLEARDTVATKGRRSALTADLLFGIGGATVAVGTILVVLSYASRRKSGRRATVTPAISRRSLGLSAEVRF